MKTHILTNQTDHAVWCGNQNPHRWTDMYELSNCISCLIAVRTFNEGGDKPREKKRARAITVLINFYKELQAR